MNRYLSTIGLYARSNLYKILLITLVTVLLAGVLVYYYPVGQEANAYYVDPDGNRMPYTYTEPYLDGVIGISRAPVVCAVGFTAIVAVMCLTGCGYGVKTDYTVRRLRVREKTACMLWAGYHAALLLFFWAVLALTLYGVMLLHCQQVKVPDGYVLESGPQTIMLLCYTDTFLHHLVPLQDVAMWGLSVSSVLAVAFVFLPPASRELQPAGTAGTGRHHRQLLLQPWGEYEFPADAASAGRGGRRVLHTDRR